MIFLEGLFLGLFIGVSIGLILGLRGKTIRKYQVRYLKVKKL